MEEAQRTRGADEGHDLPVATEQSREHACEVGWGKGTAWREQNWDKCVYDIYRLV